MVHGLAVRAALALGNYYLFFTLYREAPNMGPYLMDCFIQRERLVAMNTICRSYRPSISVDHVARLLAFGCASDCLKFLEGQKAVYIEDPLAAPHSSRLLDTKASMAHFT